MPDQLFTTWAFNATGGSTPRTMPDRLGEIKNVKDFGAVGDGVANDTAAIQAAVDYQMTPYSSENRGIIFFPVGTYKVTASITYELSDSIKFISFVGAPGAKIVGSFPDALLKRGVNTPAGTIISVEQLLLENGHAAGKAIMIHSCVGAKVVNCGISAWIGIETYNSQSITVDSCYLINASARSAGSVGIMAGNATTILDCDITAYEHGIRHQNAGLIVHGGRLEVNTVGIYLGLSEDGVTEHGSKSFSIKGVSLESNITGILMHDNAAGEISVAVTGAAAGLAHGIRIAGGNNIDLSGTTVGSSSGWSGAGITFADGTDIVFDAVASDTWNISAGIASFELRGCNTELTVSQLPISARVGTVLPVSDATATTVGSTVAGTGANHVAVVRSAGVWRII